LNVAFNKRESGIIFAVADETANMDLIQRFNLQDSGEEINVGCVGADKMFYPMPEDDFDEEVLEEFVDEVLAGKATPYIKSEKVPKEQKDVVKVVGKTFKKIVNDDSKDVLIEFYAPWCGHCKSLVPIYDELGASFKDDANTIIAKMDATANDIPSPLYEATGFPTIYFKPAGGKPMKYEKGRALDDFTKFIEENSGLGGAKDEL
jgi:protein disulfide isomerase